MTTAEYEAEMARLNLPALLEVVADRLSRFAGDADMMFGIAVSTRLDFYMRTIGMPWPRAAGFAIAMTRKHSSGPIIR